MIDYKKTALNLVGFLAVCLGVGVAIFLCIYYWPFMIGILIAIALERVINFLAKKTKISKKAIGTLMVIIFYLILGMITYLLVFTLIREVISISSSLPEIYKEIKMGYDEIYIQIQILISRTPDTISSSIYGMGLELLNKIVKTSTQFLNQFLSFVMFIPQLMIYAIITFLATLFLVTERRAIRSVAGELFPEAMLAKMSKVVSMTFSSLGKYLRAQLILITITFTELFIAFVVIGQPYPLTMALIVAAVDALPILGTGTILVPWAIYSGITGNLSFGVALFVIYLIVVIVRQLIEPKIVSKNIGVHQFITLLAMYTGFKIFGLLGLIIGPVVMVILKNVFSTMFEVGYFKNLFKYKEENKISNNIESKNKK